MKQKKRKDKIVHVKEYKGIDIYLDELTNEVQLSKGDGWMILKKGIKEIRTWVSVAEAENWIDAELKESNPRCLLTNK